jgi:hypothetical protein
MRRAYVLIREQPWYRRSAFVTGLKAAGFEALVRQPDKFVAGDVIIMWNRYASNHDLATRAEAAGVCVLIAENGYLGQGGGTPKFEVHPGGPQPGHYYAIAPRFHNDSMTVPRVDGLTEAQWSERWKALQIELKPWRTRTVDDYILICPNRSFGIPGRIMPPDWAEHAAKRLRKQHGGEVKIRAHPGNNAPRRTFLDDLAGAWAVAIWSSSCGVHALVEGIPVIVDGPNWIMKGVGENRLPHFERLAWAQWRCDEIERGVPFAHLLSST